VVVRHIALLRFEASASPVDVERVDGRVEELIHLQPVDVRASYATDLGLRPGHPRAFDRVLTLDFASVEDALEYLQSEAHLAFIDETAASIASIASIQIER
jgi:hypothetical protein